MIRETYPLLQVLFNLLIKFCICVSSSVVSGTQVLRQAPKTSSSLCREERNTTYWGSGLCIPSTLWLSLVAQSVKSLPATWETWVQSLGQEDPLEKEMAPAPVFLPGEFHGQRNLVGYSPWGHKESDMTEYFHFHLIFQRKMFNTNPTISRRYITFVLSLYYGNQNILREIEQTLSDHYCLGKPDDHIF